MLGAVAGDMIGAPYEFNDCNYKFTDFPLFSRRSGYTDDSVMTAAVAQAMMDGYGDEAKTENLVVKRMQEFGQKFPYAGYGGHFGFWLNEKNPQPSSLPVAASPRRKSVTMWKRPLAIR